MTRIPLILDCDPGVDDGVALLMAFASLDRLDLRGITTVAGNVGLAQTARNARLLRQLAGGAAERVPVLQGCARPMVRDLIVAEHFHGESGLGNLVIFEPAAPLAAGHAVNFIVETLLREPAGTITLAITGPMTNVAMAMRLEPSIVSRIRQVVFMGGARLEAGNVTASAEYNIYADPHAAAVEVRIGDDSARADLLEVGDDPGGICASGAGRRNPEFADCRARAEPVRHDKAGSERDGWRAVGEHPDMAEAVRADGDKREVGVAHENAIRHEYDLDARG